MNASLRVSVLLLLAALAPACRGPSAVSPPGPTAIPPTMRVLDDDGTFFVASGDESRPRIRYVDGQVSLNQSCAIRLDRPLNRKVPPAYVNGLPLGFC